MRVYDLILKKRSGAALFEEELQYLVEGYVRGSIPDYQVSALAMAIYFQGMNDEETLFLTRAMISSGETISLEAIPGIKIDKHSTGGVGDTTTLVLAPLVAAAGVPVAKLSGRGLGHTGGTLDKLEAIPGFCTDLSAAELVAAVNKIGVAVAGQTDNLVPADKKLYALRDVTATVDIIPLIAASIMSKKIASGADGLVLDIKCGRGAFLKTLDQAYDMADLMVNIGSRAGRETVALITGMDQPLGRAVGNGLEVQEAIQTLRGEGPADLEELCLTLGGWMLCLAGKSDHPQAGRDMLMELIKNGSALDKFVQLIESQQGNSAVVHNPGLLSCSDNRVEVKADKSGYVSLLDAEKIGLAAMALGAGREKKETRIDLSVGVILKKKIGDRVAIGDTLAVIYAGQNASAELISSEKDRILSAYNLQKEQCAKPDLLLGVVDRKER